MPAAPLDPHALFGSCEKGGLKQGDHGQGVAYKGSMWAGADTWVDRSVITFMKWI